MQAHEDNNKNKNAKKTSKTKKNFSLVRWSDPVLLIFLTGQLLSAI